MTHPIPTQRLTAEQFGEWVHLPGNDFRWFELVRGQVIELPPSDKKHGVVCALVGFFLGNHAHQTRRGYASNNAGVILERNPDTVFGPDLAYYDDYSSWDELSSGYSPVPPRLAVEVLAADDRAAHFTRKIAIYLHNGVDVVWVVDPQDRTVVLYRPDGGPQLFQETEELTGGNILSGFRCLVADFFRLPGELTKAEASATQKVPWRK